MDYIFGRILNITPHSMTDWVLEHYVLPIKKHVKSPALQMLIVILTILVFLAVSVAFVIGMIFLASYILIDVLKLT